jgi:gas vesicle structural protein
MSPDDERVGLDFETELQNLEPSERVSLCETLDRVLNKGVVVVGEVTISVADVDLVYLGLQVVLTSIEAARDNLGRGRGATGLRIEIGRE